jgi:hypothetical protein
VSFDAYLTAQQRNLDQIRLLPNFTGLVLPVHDLYERAVTLVPRTAPRLFGRLLLLSHRNLLSAATLALRALPDDAAAVLRRAVEAARTGLALKYDRDNLGRWLAYDERMERWKQRQQGAKPRSFQSRLTYPPAHPLCEELGRLFGILSDGAVHFTPEFLSQQEWRVDEGADARTIWLSYFVRDQSSIEQGLNAIASAHLLCLAAFDECYDGAFSRNPAWGAARARVQEVGQRLVPAPEPDDEEEDA